ncbi:hypothetical protein [Silvibacterium dinghuense]|uniref:Uncharacterized protein n=1 Tax=Silvibacterium dinghuense TaxID=1560006 RepID=A0A4V1NUY0_9BACT|nr:hypothetical protein [Silvibacterium dinghuense]RXS93824.1 hypothetical protein ESZ00_17445 [Silvibacterium dinghuense]GGH07996.1 hypothetical protein GCM10011586_25360 [Silvibacterium dinghuense]
MSLRLLRVLLPAAALLGGATISFAAAAPVADGGGRHAGLTVPLCGKQIVLTASYLAPSKPGEGTGFLFHLENGTAEPIVLAEPAPTSAHWYAKVGSRWLWRASSGSGGALVNAIDERGPLFAYRPAKAPENAKYLTVPAHGSQEWVAREEDNPALAYRPSCEKCNNPGEHEYRAVFAYAYLPAPGETEPHLLTCGLRSPQVIMPPQWDRH